MMKSFIKDAFVFFKQLLRFIINIKKPDVIYAAKISNGLKVHLGAGPVNIQGWINVDARGYDHTHLVAKDFDLAEFSDGSISEIYMCHVLEHFSFAEAESILRHFKRKLCVGGVIRISVPSFDQLVAVYLEGNNNLDLIKLALMGGQDYEFNFHKSIYNYLSLMEMLEACGYMDVKSWDTIADFGVDLGDWSNKSFPSSKGPLMISLNLKGINGSL
jgi:predicted SAM-dependent methyltransferase